MSYTENMTVISAVASADLSASQYEAVDFNSDGQIAVVGTKGAKSVGVLQDKPSAAGRVGVVAIGGVCKVAAGAAITAGVELIVDATGRAVTKDGAEQFVMGTALADASAAGEIIPVKLKSYQTESAA